MSIVQQINEGLQALGFSQSLAAQLDQFIAFLGVLLVAYMADSICRKILLKVVSRLVKQTKATWDDIVFDRKVMVHLSRMVAPILIYILLPLAFSDAGSATLTLIMRFCLIFIIIMFLSFISSLLAAVYTVYSEKEQFRDRPLKGLLQTVQVILYFVGGIIVVSILIDRSPGVLLTGLGASAAVLMLVFKDSIMGFVSGVQLSANNMLKVGDWITMPKYGADGDVIEVSLNTVKVRNFDKTITTIPPYLLVSDSFQNWRGMQESGGKVAHNQGAVVTTNYVVRNIRGIRTVEGNTYALYLAVLYLPRKFFQIVDGTVKDRGFPHSVDTGKDIHVGT
jgi:miniconductance mechanosensitive channel